MFTSGPNTVSVASPGPNVSILIVADPGALTTSQLSPTYASMDELSVLSDESIAIDRSLLNTFGFLANFL